MTTGNITRDILHRQIRVSKQMPEHPESSIYQWTDNAVMYRNNPGGIDPNRLSPTKSIVYTFCNYYFQCTKVWWSLWFMSRIRECQASKGSIMWLTPSSRDWDWRLSFRSVTASVCRCGGNGLRKERETEDFSVYYYIFLHCYCMSLQGHTGCVNCLEWNEQGE